MILTPDQLKQIAFMFGLEFCHNPSEWDPATNAPVQQNIAPAIIPLHVHKDPYTNPTQDSWLQVADGKIKFGDMVWWASIYGPLERPSNDLATWPNIVECPQYYFINKPTEYPVAGHFYQVESK